MNKLRHMFNVMASDGGIPGMVTLAAAANYFTAAVIAFSGQPVYALAILAIAAPVSVTAVRFYRKAEESMTQDKEKKEQPPRP